MNLPRPWFGRSCRSTLDKSVESGHPNHQPMLDALHAIFDKYQADGNVSFDYVTLLYFGHRA